MFRTVFFTEIATELIVNTMGKGNTETEWQDHAGQADAHGNLPIRTKHSGINFEADEEEKEQEAQVGNVAQNGHRFGREDVLLEIGDSHHHRRT